MATSDASTADREIVIERTVNAPRELVWQAWIEADQIRQWWGPNGFTTTIHAMDVRVGGVWRFIMHGPDGTDYPNRIVYREIVKPERLVYDHDDDNDPPSHSFRSTVTFVAQGCKTKVTLQVVFASVEAREASVKFGAVEGGEQTLARLDQYLAATPVKGSPPR
jgi:uncharacterized protein YndB with AHSA1/START domain